MSKSLDRCGYVVEPTDVDAADKNKERWYLDTEAVCCYRTTWRDTGRCIWHAESREKSLSELQEVQLSPHKRLDGAYLEEITLGNEISFSQCNLLGAQFTRCDLSGADFSKSNLRKAQFSHSNLANAIFSESNLQDVEFDNTDIPAGVFTNAFLKWADFSEGNFKWCDFKKADIRRAIFSGTKLEECKFTNAILRETEFSSANLNGATLTECDLRSAKFRDTKLIGADLSNADLRTSVFIDTNLEEAVLERSDLRGADLSRARFYQARLSETRINNATTFGTNSQNGGRPICTYERNPTVEVEVTDELHPFEAAAWTYRRLENLHKENALSERSQDFHILKHEVQRKHHYEQRRWPKYIVSSANRYLTYHGESLKQVLYVSGGIILTSAVLFPFVGGFQDNGVLYRLNSVPELFTSKGTETIVHAIYFSIITFTTIGYANGAPRGIGSRVLIGIESLLGAIMVALFVFVLGRRVAR